MYRCVVLSLCTNNRNILYSAERSERVSEYNFFQFSTLTANGNLRFKIFFSMLLTMKIFMFYACLDLYGSLWLVNC